jgi:23S rRNA (uracil1939-C5)-methyltransferase
MGNDNLHEFTIKNISHDGRGVGHIDGKTTFIDGALTDEIVIARIQKKHKNYNDAELVEVIKASEARITPGCPHFLICGGCSLQHVSPSAQIHLKQTILAEQFHHFANHLVPQHWLPPITDSSWHYRHKARLGVKYVRKKEKVLVGFREKRTNKIAALETCPILHESVGRHLKTLADFIATLDAFEQIPQIEVAVGDNATALVFRHLIPLSEKDFQALIQFGKTYGYWIYLQSKGIDSIYRIHPDLSNEKLFYHLPEQDLTLEFEPYHFIQINPKINQKMIKQALSLLQLHDNDIVLDLFSGLGNFSLALAKHAKEVVALEGEQALCDYGKYNADKNKLPHCQFIKADLHDEESLLKNPPWPKKAYTKALIDPPRTGAKALIEQLITLQIQKILYVSCNPATLARDAQILTKNGYVLTHCGVMDMFPHTNHVESMALFETVSPKQ